MQYEKSRWKNYNAKNKNSVNGLLKNCVLRKLDIEKILFSYHNLHLLSPWYSESAHKAFSSNDPSALWSYENEVILNSRDVENLMNQKRVSYTTPESQTNYNGNLVNTLDASYQPMPPQLMPTPQPPPRPTQSFNMSYPPPPIPYQMQAPMHQSNGYHDSSVHMTPPCYPIASVTGQHPQNQIVPPYVSPNFVPIHEYPPHGNLYSTEIPVASQYPFPNNDDDYTEYVYDTNGCAYKRVVYTTTCLVPVQCGTSFSLSTSYSTASEQSFTPYSTQSESLSQYFDQNDEKVSENSADEDENVLDDKQDARTPRVDLENELGNSQDLEETRQDDANSIDTQSVRVGSSSSLDTPEPVPDDVLKPTTASLEDVKCAVSDDQSQEVVESEIDINNQNALIENECIVEPTSLSASESVEETVKEEKEEDNGNMKEFIKPHKEKLTKKEKRIKAAKEAKELETDDDVLQKALEERRRHDERSLSTDSGVSSLITKEKKKQRKTPKVIVESVSVSNPPTQAVNPHILHAVKMAVINRADNLKKNGRPTTSEYPARQEYLDKVAEFEKGRKFDKKDIASVKTFIKSRIFAFQQIQRPQSLSRITIYEHLYLGLPRVYIPELCFLKFISSHESDKSQFELYEEVFFNMF